MLLLCLVQSLAATSRAVCQGVYRRGGAREVREGAARCMGIPVSNELGGWPAHSPCPGAGSTSQVTAHTVNTAPAIPLPLPGTD